MKEGYIQLSTGKFYVGGPSSEGRYEQLAAVMFYAKGKPDTPEWRDLFQQQQRTFSPDYDWTPMLHRERKWIYPKWVIEIVDWFRKNDSETIEKLKKEFGEERVNQTPTLDELTVE